MSKEMDNRLRELSDQYAREIGATEITAADVTDWAVAAHKLDRRLSPALTAVYWRDAISAALQRHTIKLDNGHIVRARICVRVDVAAEPSEDDEEDAPPRPTQKYLWALISDAPRDFIKRGFEQRRQGMEADHHRFFADLDYANSCLRRRGLRPIQMDLDFGHPPDAGAGA